MLCDRSTRAGAPSDRYARAAAAQRRRGVRAGAPCSRPSRAQPFSHAKLPGRAEPTCATPTAPGPPTDPADQLSPALGAIARPIPLTTAPPRPGPDAANNPAANQEAYGIHPAQTHLHPHPAPTPPTSHRTATHSHRADLRRAPGTRHLDGARADDRPGAGGLLPRGQAAALPLPGPRLRARTAGGAGSDDRGRPGPVRGDVACLPALRSGPGHRRRAHSPGGRHGAHHVAQHGPSPPARAGRGRARYGPGRAGCHRVRRGSARTGRQRRRLGPALVRSHRGLHGHGGSAARGCAGLRGAAALGVRVAAGRQQKRGAESTAGGSGVRAGCGACGREPSRSCSGVRGRPQGPAVAADERRGPERTPASRSGASIGPASRGRSPLALWSGPGRRTRRGADDVAPRHPARRGNAAHSPAPNSRAQGRSPA